MGIPREFMDMVENDIVRIGQASEMSYEERLQLHRELDGRYQSCIKNWGLGFWCTIRDSGYVCYSTLAWDEGGVLDNLKMMKAKLETYRFQLNAVTADTPAQQINVTTNVNVSVTFEQVRSQIEDMSSLSQEQTDEILEKIDELEEISKEKSSRKTKWEKVKPIIAFALDKGADVAIAILSLVMQMKLGM